MSQVGMAKCDNSSQASEELSTPRLEFVQASDCLDLGKQLAKVYSTRAEAGLKRTKGFYVLKEPITCSMEKWQHLAEKIRLGTEKCCPAASQFFNGLTEELGRDAYMGMLDFELYTLELHRQTKAKAARKEKGGAQSRSSSSSSTSSSTITQIDCGIGNMVAKSTDDSSVEENVSSSVVSSDDTSAPQSTLARSKRDRQNNSSKNTGDGPQDSSGKRPKQITREREQQGNTFAESLPNPSDIEQSKLIELPGHCTGFALASRKAQDSNGACAILAQSVDLPGSMYGYGDFDSALQLSIPNKRILLYDCDGRLCPIGCNSEGLGVTIFCFHQTSENGYDAEAALSVQCIVWELLLGHASVATAVAWLEKLCVPVMCGSALLIADRNGAVNVELGPSGAAQITEVRQNVPIVRANHPALERFVATCGSSAKAKRSSSHRQRHLSREIMKYWQDAEIALTAPLGLILLGFAKKVRTNATLACVSMDLNKVELHVHFRERQLANDPELLDHISKRHNITRERAEKMLTLGAFRGDIGELRLSTGEPAPHLINWKSYKFASES